MENMFKNAYFGKLFETMDDYQSFVEFQKRQKPLVMKKNKLKKRKWYKSTITPLQNVDLVIMTDMGYMFHAVFQKGVWCRYQERNYKMYLEPMSVCSIYKWMIV